MQKKLNLILKNSQLIIASLLLIWLCIEIYIYNTNQKNSIIYFFTEFKEENIKKDLYEILIDNQIIEEHIESKNEKDIFPSNDINKLYLQKLSKSKNNIDLVNKINEINSKHKELYITKFDYSVSENLIDDLRHYLVEPDKYPQTKEWLIKEANKFSIPNIKQDVAIEAIKSSIIYHYINIENKNVMFSNISNIDDRIDLSAKLLVTVAELETGGHDHSISAWSYTQAWGRFQINGLTASDFIFNAIAKDILPLEKVDISHLSDKKYVYGKIKQLVDEMEENHYKKFNEKWSSKYKKKQIDNMLIFGRSFIRTTQKLKSKGKSYLDLDNKPKFISTYIRDYNSSLSDGKYWDIVLKFIEFYKKPVNQGLASLEVLELKSKYAKINKKEIKTNKNLDKFVSKLLLFYNGDNNKKIYKGKEILVKEYYSNKGKTLFKENFEGALIVSN